MTFASILRKRVVILFESTHVFFSISLVGNSPKFHSEIG